MPDSGSVDLSISRIEGGLRDQDEVVLGFVTESVKRLRAEHARMCRVRRESFPQGMPDRRFQKSLYESWHRLDNWIGLLDNAICDGPKQGETNQ